MEYGTFRKKPVVIDAVRFVADEKERTAIYPKWIIDALALDRGQAGAVWEDENSARTAVLCIRTLEGVMTAQDGDWIIRGVKGELYPCKPDIFAATYERVE